jgi:hypothetical protein
MIRKVNKPVGEVARQILSYVDPESQMQIFTLIGFNSQPGQPLTNSPSLDDPTTLEGDEYAVCHRYHSDDCVIKDQSDPRYLNASAVIADINKNWGVPTETQLRWRPDHMQHPPHKVGYEKLEKLLQE